LTVRSGETIVIGGLIQEQLQRSVQQIPFFGSLPVVGRLFRDETTTINRNEIIVLITPTIIDEEEEYARARCEVDRFTERRDGLDQSLPQYTRPALARKHFQNACSYRDMGNTEKALELVELSISFDPTYEPALELRRELQLTLEAQPPLGASSHTDQPLLLYPVPSRQ
jgi:hypothetical protein